MSGSAPRIVVVGLGPGDPELRTMGAQRALGEADAIILRTRVHPGIDDLADDPRVRDCDDLYQHAGRFDELYPAIARRVVNLAASGRGVVYAVPGHPRFAEQSVVLIEALAHERGIPVTILDAVSFVDAALNAARVDPLARGLQIADAEHLAATLEAEPFGAGALGIDPAQPLLIAQLYDDRLAAATKLALTRVYPDEHRILLIRGAGGAEEAATRWIALHELDREHPDHLTSLWAPPFPPIDAARGGETLTRIVARLRAPGGCPWDREQTHASLRDAILEEAYETVDAIDAEDDAGLAEELGDLLLLVTMHAQLAEEAGAFRVEDVYEGINRKLIRRHPHVFGEIDAPTPGAVIATWEGVKAQERAEKGRPAPESSLDRLPRSMPALRKAAEILAPRAVLISPGDVRAGDALFAAIDALISRGIDPERALEASLRRYERHKHGERLATGMQPGQQSGKGA